MTSLPSVPPVVDVAWLTDHPTAVVADVRSYVDGRVGRDAFDAGHVPGAVFVDLDTDLAAPPSAAAGRHPLPPPEAFAASMSRLGIGDDDVVVAYDDAGGSIAARLVWMLRVLGRAAAVLDGGMATWTGDLEAGPGEPRPVATFTATPWPADRIATIDDVQAALDDPAVTVVDARAAGRFTGEVDSPLDPRPGHVPSARSLPWEGNLDPTTGRFASVPELRDRIATVLDTGTRADTDTGAGVIVYCGSGVTACHDLLALELAGVTGARLFPGSWSAWAADPDRPVDTGP